MNKDYFYSPIGNIQVIAGVNNIKSISFVEGDAKEKYPSLLTDVCIQQLYEYFSGKRMNFDLNLNIDGTTFQKHVWNMLLNVKYGHTISYSDFSRKIGRADAVRAIARAMSVNPLAIVVPCHRVIAKDGTLQGYAGGLWRKKFLLDLESSVESIF